MVVTLPTDKLDLPTSSVSWGEKYVKRGLGFLLSALGVGNWMLPGQGGRFVPATLGEHPWWKKGSFLDERGQ